MDYHYTALTLGIGTVVASHTMMVVFPQEAQKVYHAYINLVAAAAIIYGAKWRA